MVVNQVVNGMEKSGKESQESESEKKRWSE